MNFNSIPFKELSAQQLFNIYKLRSEVFIVEQHCAYQDVDDFDLKANHILLSNNNELIAYARILPPNTNYPQPSIGRVCVSINHRSHKYGKQLMNFCIKETKGLYPKQQIVISAQTYLLKFYTELGFTAIGEGYLEDDIPHIKMYL
ncbi:MAG: GNAT family N-acetyltransferase [Bacteroidota bacterium]|nr:GNAT family N-acetyltransferase [Bacteroidota bacterium]